MYSIYLLYVTNEEVISMAAYLANPVIHRMNGDKVIDSRSISPEELSVIFGPPPKKQPKPWTDKLYHKPIGLGH